MGKNLAQQIKNAFRTVFTRSRSYKLWLLVLTVFFFAAYILIPVWLTPGNSIAFQLSLFQTRDYFLFAALSLLISLLVVMQLFIFKQARKGKDKIGAIGQGSIGASSALFGGMLVTTACSSCIAAIVGFLGTGSVFLFLKIRCM